MSRKFRDLLCGNRNILGSVIRETRGKYFDVISRKGIIRGLVNRNRDIYEP